MVLAHLGHYSDWLGFLLPLLTVALFLLVTRARANRN